MKSNRVSRRSKKRSPATSFVTSQTKPKTYPNTHQKKTGNDSNFLIVFYVQIMPDDLVMQLH
ncbi:hypothetical protein, partial [Escherichia coli]|uniref:hypothetical protein n=1 Tax=Escherichia coli TaxID=562 RepID=UPI00300719E4